MEKNGLIFIPDISGFTRFVTETEIDHSRLIIQELLELLINDNQIGLEISEIEGDAILFYKFGDSPDLKDVYGQVEKMFVDFHRQLNSYDVRRFCQCKACISAVDLTLKVITHYGEFTEYNVRNFNKLIGKDIIVAHQLLKNDIPQHEYWLVTQDLLHDNRPVSFTNWMEWNTSVKQTENGEIPYHYTQLSDLKKHLPPEEPLKLELAEKVKVFSISREFDTHLIALAHAVGNFDYRSRWQDGVTAVEGVSHFLPRIGMESRLITDKGTITVLASSFHFEPKRIEFAETNKEKSYSTYYTLEAITENKTRLILDYYIPKNILGQILFSISKKQKIIKSLEASMEGLAAFVTVLEVPREY